MITIPYGAEIDFDAIRGRTNWEDLRAEGVVMQTMADKLYVQCPFHSDKSPSNQLFPDGGFYCHGCQESGDLLKMVARLNPDLKGYRAVLKHIFGELEPWMFKGVQRKGAKVSERQSPQPVTPHVPTPEEESALADVIFDATKILFSHPNEVEMKAKLLRTAPRCEHLRAMARARGWLPEGLASRATEYPIGDAGDGLYFPKLTLTAKMAELYGFGQKWQEQGRWACIGWKRRLTEEALSEWHANLVAQAKDVRSNGSRILVDDLPRWIAKTYRDNKYEYPNAVPFEFDANEDAPILVVLEGPSDGYTLHLQANATEELYARCGGRWHITAVDSATSFKPTYFNRKVVSVGEGNPLADDGQFPIGFFMGYESIVLIMDPDDAGRKAAAKAKAIAARQAPNTPVLDVVLPDLLDVCAYFRNGFTMEDLLDEIGKAKHRLLEERRRAKSNGGS